MMSYLQGVRSGEGYASFMSQDMSNCMFSELFGPQNQGSAQET